MLEHDPVFLPQQEEEEEEEAESPELPAEVITNNDLEGTLSVNNRVALGQLNTGKHSMILTFSALGLAIVAFLAFFAAIYCIRSWLYQDPQDEFNELNR